MIILVSGSRSITNYNTFQSLLLKTGWKIDLIVHGGAQGVDTLAAQFCMEFKIKEKVFIPDWTKHGKAAGVKRNCQMVDYVKEHGGKVFILHDGESKGTKQCKEYAESKGVEVYYCVVKKKIHYTIQTLEELNAKIANAEIVSADLARNLIEQLIQTKKEYIQVAKDVRLMNQAIIELRMYEDESDCSTLHDALICPTSKYLLKERNEKN